MSPATTSRTSIAPRETAREGPSTDVQKLGIKVTHYEPLIVEAFGGTHIMRCTSARIKLKMRRTDARFRTTSVNSVPKLCLCNNLNGRERVARDIRHRLCEEHDRLLWPIEALSRTDPTTAARILLKRIGIAAESIGDMLKVFPRKKLEISEWVLDIIDRNRQAWEQSAEVEKKSTADSVRDKAVEIEAVEIIDNCSVTLAKELEDIALHWRWITVAAFIVATAAECVAVVFF
ncbi:unnamed protein product [Toxocara canis]|uniref:Uncharacterized protein n=1 Tax=Toxocara canis TaxID=6265 RepID=A0A183UK73_TOXCA|nr:unnamed protein product [Toxocara canis]